MEGRGFDPPSASFGVLLFQCIEICVDVALLPSSTLSIRRQRRGGVLLLLDTRGAGFDSQEPLFLLLLLFLFLFLLMIFYIQIGRAHV